MVIINTTKTHKSGPGIHVFSQAGVESIQHHECFCLKPKDTCPCWQKQKIKACFNPERMTLGLSRSAFKTMTAYQDICSEEEYEEIGKGPPSTGIQTQNQPTPLKEED